MDFFSLFLYPCHPCAIHPICQYFPLFTNIRRLLSSSTSTYCMNFRFCVQAAGQPFISSSDSTNFIYNCRMPNVYICICNMHASCQFESSWFFNFNPYRYVIINCPNSKQLKCPDFGPIAESKSYEHTQTHRCTILFEMTTLSVGIICNGFSINIFPFYFCRWFDNNDVCLQFAYIFTFLLFSNFDCIHNNNNNRIHRTLNNII